MNASRAVELLGPHIQPGPSLSSVIETLGTMSIFVPPTDLERERLEAAVWVQKNQKAYADECGRISN